MKKGNLRFFIASILSLSILFSLFNPVKVGAVAGKTWSGTVFDIRTGLPLEGITFKAGVAGRVDAFPKYLQITKQDGKFSITWDNESWKVWNGDNVNHYLRVNANENGREKNLGGYWDVTVIRRQPTQELSIYLIPSTVFIQGKVVSAETNGPLSDVRVSLVRPGAVDKSVETDQQGFFKFPIAFRAFKDYSYKGLYDVSPSSLTEDQPRLPGEYMSYTLAIQGTYADISAPVVDGRFSPSLPLLSSYTDAIHTFVTIRAVKNGQPLPPNGVRAEIRGKILQEPFTLRAYPGLSKVYLEWTAPRDTTTVIGYNLYRKTKNMPYGSPITDFPIKTLNHVDVNVDNGEYACYYMKAVYKDKTESAASNEVCVTPNPLKPVINIPDNATTKDPNFTFTGKVDPGSTVTVNGKTVEVASDGFFTATVQLNPGKNIVSILVKNKAGDMVSSSHPITLTTGKDGKITILLTIGSKKSFVNQELVVLDVAPFIDRGRTFVPFRFIGESLGAKVGFTKNSAGLVDSVTYELDATAIILYIGKREAKVNGRTVMLDVPPQIVQGRTVIPLRFVTEALGCKVDWDGEKMEVLIIYPA
jgi:hypothetical protein